MLTLLIFLLVLSVLVVVHEFWHFITAKRAGLRVDEFGFGFPPRIVGFRKRTGSLAALGTTSWEVVWGNPKGFEVREGGTLYSINALPFGGFVRVKGESGEHAKEPDSFASRSALTRVIIVAAGVVMNLVLAVALFAGGFMIGFPQVLDGTTSAHARIEERRIEILNVLAESPAGNAGLQLGDRAIAGNGRAFVHAEEFKSFVTEFLGRPVELVVERKGTRHEVTVTPEILEETGKPGIGIAIADVGEVRYPLWLAVPKALQFTFVLIGTIAVALADLLRDAVMGQPVAADLTGPIGIAVLSGAAARQGILPLLQFIAILSVNLAFLNIIPFPALDGGRILFVLVEKLRGRPVARRVEAIIHSAGFVLLILLVLFVTYRDLGRYGGRIVEVVKSLAQ